MGLVTVRDLDDRHIEYRDQTQARAEIEDVSADARACVAPDLDEVDAEDQTATAVSQGVPAAVVSIVIRVVRRALANPRSATQESLGDYSYSASTAALGGAMLTDRECRRLRRAVGRLGAGAIESSAPLPAQPSEQYRSAGGRLL